MPQGKRNEPTVEPTAADYQYAAGFIDGEGCITVRASPGTVDHLNGYRGWNPSMYASVTASQADPNEFVLRWFAERWGGSIRKKPERGRMARDAHEWCIVGRQAYRFLLGVLPMLKVKGPHAENALRLYYLRGEDPRSRKGRQPGRGHGNYLSDEAVATQADVLAQARLLNARGAGPGYLKMRPEVGHGDG